MVVVVGGFASADIIGDAEDAALQIDGAGDLEVLTTATGTFVYVAGNDDDGLSVFSVGSDGALTNVQNLSYSASLSLRKIDNMTTASVGGHTYLYVEGDGADIFDHGITCFEVAADGTLTFLHRQVEVAGAPTLGGPGDIQSVTVGGTTYLYARGDGAVADPFYRKIEVLNLYRIETDGQLTPTFSQEMTGDTEETAIATVGGHTYLIEPIANLLGPSGISVVEILSNGTASLAGGISNYYHPEIGTPIDVVTATVGGASFVISANLSFSTNSLCVLTLDANGQLATVAQPQATLDLLSGLATNVSVFTLGGDTFITALRSQPVTNLLGMLVFRLDASGILTPVSNNIFGNEWGAYDPAITFIDGQPVYTSTNFATDTVKTFLLGGGDDTLVGGTGDDLLLGYGGDDVMTGGAGADTLDGGAGLDTADYSDKTAAVVATLNGSFNATVTVGGVNEDVIRNVENLIGGSAGDTLFGDDLVNDIRGLGGDDTLRSGLGLDTLDGGSGLDTVDYRDRAVSIVVALNGAADVTVSVGGVVEDTIRNIENVLGGIAADTLTGDGEDNFLSGGGDNDILTGGGGNDLLRGGRGNDTMDGGGGSDTVDYSDKLAAIVVTLDGANDSIATVGGIGEDTIRNIENIIGGNVADVLTGDGLGNTIAGGLGGDTLNGAGGNDRLTGGSGNDTLDGGDGADTADYGDKVATIILTLNGANDSIVTVGGIAEDTIRNIESLVGGSAADALTGDGLNNTISGGLGGDLLIGAGGDDLLIGGSGDDGLDGGDGADTADYGDKSAAVVVTLDSFHNSTVTVGGIAEDTIRNIENLNGGSAADILTGDGLNNTIKGGAGGDSLAGAGGDDRLNGGLGSDVMDGGAGDDTFIVDTALDAVTEALGGGNDTVITVVSYTLAAGAEIERLMTSNVALKTPINLTGNEFDNNITGNAGNNRLSGGGGVDTMTGLGGNDTYVVDNAADVVKEAAGGGTDTVVALVSYALGAGVEIERLSTANAAAKTAIDLTGNGFGNIITGNAGNNRLSGGGGIDTMKGLGGNDTYVVDRAADVVVEAAGRGIDTVLADVSYTLAAGTVIERLWTSNISGVTAINLTGNEFNNIIIGNAGANILNGRGGSDTMDGGLGADIFRFDSALDATNVDTVKNFVVADDTIQLAKSVFGAFTTNGKLAATAFNTGTAASDGDDRIIYDATTGALLYDLDGTGTGTAVQFAKLTGVNGTLGAADFVII